LNQREQVQLSGFWSQLWLPFFGHREEDGTNASIIMETVFWVNTFVRSDLFYIVLARNRRFGRLHGDILSWSVSCLAQSPLDCAAVTPGYSNVYIVVLIFCQTIICKFGWNRSVLRAPWNIKPGSFVAFSGGFIRIVSEFIRSSHWSSWIAHSTNNTFSILHFLMGRNYVYEPLLTSKQ
jgi:hypothetical protein